jgi:hypothetical protein
MPRHWKATLTLSELKPQQWRTVLIMSMNACEYFWSGVKLHLLSHAATPKSELNKILSKAAAVANIFKHLFDYGTVELV